MHGGLARDPPAWRRAIAEELRRARRKISLSRRKLADAAIIDPERLSRLEAGRAVPSIDEWLAIDRAVERALRRKRKGGRQRSVTWFQCGAS